MIVILVHCHYHYHHHFVIIITFISDRKNTLPIIIIIVRKLNLPFNPFVFYHM